MSGSAMTHENDNQQAPTVTNKLTAVLEEYKAMRAEIQARSDVQNRLIQIYMAVLPIITGAAISAQTERWGQWIVLVIPLLSAMIALWWLDNGIRIREIGTFIKTTVEPRANELLGYDIQDQSSQKGMSAESEFYKQEWRSRRHRWHLDYFGTLRFLTFAVPSGLSLLMACVLLGVSLSTDLVYQGVGKYIATIVIATSLAAFWYLMVAFKEYRGFSNELYGSAEGGPLPRSAIWDWWQTPAAPPGGSPPANGAPGRSTGT